MNSNDKIDLIQIFRVLIAKKKFFAKVLISTFCIASIFIIGFPRTYTTDIKLAPELNNNSLSNMGSLGSIASSFGIDLTEFNQNDAISPLLYPNLIEDNKFICDLFNITVESKDKEIHASYYDYQTKYKRGPIWFIPIDWIKNLFKEKSASSADSIDPYNLSMQNQEIVKQIREDISIKVDKKTAIITIEATAQDPVICKTIADSLKKRLQDFITEYRTNKARTDFNYFKQLAEDAQKDYEKARQKYGSTSDASTKVSLRSVELKLEDMENEMQLKFNTYSTLNNQLQAAKAKVQERTPAFTVIKGAEVPIKPTGPKRMIFVIVCLLLAFTATSIYILSESTKKN